MNYSLGHKTVWVIIHLYNSYNVLSIYEWQICLISSKNIDYCINIQKQWFTHYIHALVKDNNIETFTGVIVYL